MSEYIAFKDPSPSHSIMFNDDVLNDDKEVMIQDALVAMNDDEQGLAILNNVLGTDAIIATDTDLGTYGAALVNIPGISSKYGNAFTDGTETYQIYN